MKPDLSGAQFALLKDNGTKLVVALFSDGTVEFGEGITPSEAATEFWLNLSRLSQTEPIYANKTSTVDSKL